MKAQSWLFTFIGASVAAYLGTVAYIHHFDKQEMQRRLQESQTSNAQQHAVETVFYHNGCQYCHSRNANMPFYFNLPFAKELMEKDIQQGQAHFLLDNVTNNFEQPQHISAADLAKLESVIQHNEMPIHSFKMVHWGSGLDEQEKKTLLDWIHKVRQEYQLPANTVGTSAERFVQPIPQNLSVNPAKVELGNTLYHSTALSGDGTIACASCHALNTGGVDNLATSTGIKGQKGGINAPTVYNAAFNVVQFWDGRAANLAEQAGGPPLNPVEMGAENWQQIVNNLNQDAEFRHAFEKVYPEGFNEKTITDAIAEFEKTLITPNSHFDRYLQGDENALTSAQKSGYALFHQYKCDTCHTGVNLGGQSYELMGLKADYFADRNKPLTEADDGRFSQTQNPYDKHRFKVPTLRNIALTAPYFHDANAQDLTQAVEMMLKYQSGVTLPKTQVNDIVEFLYSLTGEYQGKPLTNENIQQSHSTK
ncbi:cytochrome-c peroxidase [Avibacterium paragallinarum]|uniref:Cytochrome-c peroxidase n=1 Tax=Avibacterium paragallinarum TaxID=728 RepID=A0AAE5WFZ5_AVIPA|nr:cytochrome-c peroxidase [Avibacterium paragallinarum]MEE3609101.1 cytochrome-c peroxidase [Avibacterium paragallinarum]MEE3621170.1 cytochrome-c peroxidase [Avibacterium paragallinarum]MEE3668967.1 cytochrome-c peroxidase [Avibacterium paragallinarum]MEE3681475.1 cytochrome-c peroxidase [Avibacterium paragallinarum]MEE4386277.1 cytochrome-c peroxidase [Avibacterium paragallinarum]